MTDPIFPPNPHETIAPTDTIDAFASALVGLIDEMPREVIKDQLDTMSTIAVATQVFPMQNSFGRLFERELNPVERQLTDAVRWCATNALLGACHEAITGLAIIRELVNDGEVFVGRELPYSHYNRASNS